MTFNEKYGRTFHFPFSPGVSDDDQINQHYWQDINAIGKIVHTEKLDGENNCINRFGVFARSHAAPAVSPWTASLRQKWDMIKHDIGDYEIFGENLYAIHSITYPDIESHFYVFAVREHDQWLSWEETGFIAGIYDLPVVPVLEMPEKLPDQRTFEQHIIALAGRESTFRSCDVRSGAECSMEGIVTRNLDSYPVSAFAHNVFKYVRKDHVATDVHWTKNWKRSPLKHERK